MTSEWQWRQKEVWNQKQAQPVMWDSIIVMWIHFNVKEIGTCQVSQNQKMRAKITIIETPILDSLFAQYCGPRIQCRNFVEPNSGFKRATGNCSGSFLSIVFFALNFKSFHQVLPWTEHAMGIRKNPFPRRFLPFKDPDFCAKPSMVVTISRGKHPPWMGETRHMHDTPTSKFLETKHQRKGEMRMAGSGYSDWMYKNPRGSYWKFGSRIRSFWGILQKKTSIKGPLVFFFHVGDFAASFRPGFLPVAPRKSSKMRPGSKGRGNQWDGKSIGFP